MWLRVALQRVIIIDMKRFGLLGIIIFSNAIVLTAQANEQSIGEVRPVPARVRAGLPRKAISIACFTVNAARKDNQVLIHIYSIPDQHIDPYVDPTKQETDFLAVFTRGSKGHTRHGRKGSHLRRINLLNLGRFELRPWFRPYHIAADAFGLMWLEPKRHRGPIITLKGIHQGDGLFIFLKASKRRGLRKHLKVLTVGQI